MSAIQKPDIDLSSYINLAKRRKWWILLPFLCCLMSGMLFLLFSQKVYRATTLIMLEPQSVPDSFVKTTVTETIEGRLKTIQQQIHSRTNLEKIIQDFRLADTYKDDLIERSFRALKRWVSAVAFGRQTPKQAEEAEKVRIAEIVEKLRKSIEVTLKGSAASKGQNVAFEISFLSHDREIIAPIVNSVASRFIEENLNVREEIAVGTTDFLEQETLSLRTELEKREAELERFKSENMGRLPDQLQSNLNIINQLGEQLKNLERRVDQEKQQILLLRAQAHADRAARSTTEFPAVMERSLGQSGVRDSRALTREQLTSGSLEDLETELERLTAQYTDKHPDVTAIKRRIDTLRSERPPRGQASPDAATHHANSGDILTVQLAPIHARIESYQQEIAETEKRIQFYRERVERIPQVEMEMNKLTRDYQTVRQRYDILLAKKLDAKMAEQLEKRRKGEQFRVLDPALKPVKPFKPNPLKTMAMALALGLGMGGGLAYLREILDPCFYSPEDLESFLGVPVMVSLPLADKSKQA